MNFSKTLVMNGRAIKNHPKVVCSTNHLIQFSYSSYILWVYCIYRVSISADPISIICYHFFLFAKISWEKKGPSLL